LCWVSNRFTDPGPVPVFVNSHPLLRAVLKVSTNPRGKVRYSWRALRGKGETSTDLWNHLLANSNVVFDLIVFDNESGTLSLFKVSWYRSANRSSLITISSPRILNDFGLAPHLEARNPTSNPWVSANTGHEL